MWRRYRFVGPFTLLYALGFGAWSVLGRNAEFVLYGAVMAFLIGLVLAADARVRFSAGVLWGLSVWGFLHMAGGNVPIPAALADGQGAQPVLYSLRLAELAPRYDQAVHAFGFFMATMAAWQALKPGLVRGRAVTAGQAFLVANMGMGLGALNELVEFAATRLLPQTNVGGYVNTGWDLVANAIGAFVAAALIWLNAERR